MDWTIGLFFIILAVSILLIVITLVSLPKLGDERTNYIKMKAQSYTFTVVIGVLLLEIVESIYLTTWTDRSYEGINPFIFLPVISIVYLISLQLSKRKYGG